MTRALAYSTLGLPQDWTSGQILAALVRHGFNGVEIALRPDQIAAADDAALWRAMREEAAAAGVAITALHLGNPRLYADPNAPRFLNDDPAERDRHVALAAAAMKIADTLGCPRVATASGTPNPHLDAEASMGRLTAGLDRCLADAPSGVDFLLEHEPEHFIAATDQILELYERTGGRVACNLDVGHTEVAGEPIGDSIRRLGAVIRNVHLEDIRDRVHRHLLPGEGEIDFDEVRAALDDIGYSGPLTADLYPYLDTPEVALAAASRAFGPMSA